MRIKLFILLALLMELSYKQTQALDYLEDDVTTELLYGGAAGGGKSILGCYWGTKMSLKYPGSRGLIGRATLKTLRETTLISFFKVAKMQGLVRDVHYRYVAPSNIIFKNGSEILLKDLGYYPSDPEFDELGSLEITWAFIDEANQVINKAKQIVRSRIRHGLDEYGLIPKSLYTCNPAKNWVKTEYYVPYTKGILPVHKKFIHALVTDNEFISKHYPKSLSELDPASRARLLDGSFDYSDDPSQLMTSEAIAAIFTNSHVKADKEFKCITADIARMGKDTTIIRVWYGWRVVEKIVLRKKKTTESAAEIQRLALKHEIPMWKVLVDENGVGGGVMDQLNCKGFIANATPISPGPEGFKGDNYGMLKDQCAWYLADKVNKGLVFELCTLDDQEITSQELSWIKKVQADKVGKNKILDKAAVKAELGRSPDDGDTFIMRAWFDVTNVLGFNVISRPQSGISNGRTI